MTGVRIVKILSALQVGLLLSMFLFRAAIYEHIYIGPDDPYGLADVIELLIGWIHIAVASASIIVAAVLIARGTSLNRQPSNRLAGVLLLAITAGAVLLVEPLHSVARVVGR